MERFSRASDAQPPAGLANVLNPTDEQRDSAYYSSNGDASKHTSTASCNGQNVFTPPGSHYGSSSADKTPSPIATSTLQPQVISPGTAGMSVASLVSPTTPSTLDQSMLNKLDARPGYGSGQGLPSLGPNGEPLSRRESTDSRLNHSLGEMRLASSPYASANQSTTSIQSSLQQQRNPGNAPAPERLSATRYSNGGYSNGYQPNQQRFAVDAQRQARTAPAITGPAAGSVAHAAEPTKGQAWAFPDEPIQRMPSSGTRSTENMSLNNQSSFLDSRRSSLAESLASSQYTTESRLPPGQRRLEDGMPSDFQRLSRASSEFQNTHHHHSLQHKQVGDLRGEDTGSPGSTGIYSRTPELRVSHKLAERKRRTEMKDLFEQLRDLMPQERGNKASKWEILSRAITEHHRQDDYIKALQEQCQRVNEELHFAKQESNMLRQENRQLRADLSGHSGAPGAIHTQPAPPLHHLNAPPPLPQAANGPVAPMDPYANDPYARRPVENRNELPPLRSMQQAQPESMTGVQYQHEPSRVNGFHGDRF